MKKDKLRIVLIILISIMSGIAFTLLFNSNLQFLSPIPIIIATTAMLYIYRKSKKIIDDERTKFLRYKAISIASGIFISAIVIVSYILYFVSFKGQNSNILSIIPIVLLFWYLIFIIVYVYLKRNY